MRIRRVIRCAAFGSAIALMLGASACDDGDDTPNVTPVASVSATAASATPVMTAAPRTVEPGTTPRPAVTIELVAEPQQLTCDGERVSIVTARVLDGDLQPVDDGTPVTFSVQALATAEPINTVTSGGAATTSVVALGSEVGVVVNVTSGKAASAIRIDCV